MLAEYARTTGDATQVTLRSSLLFHNLDADLLLDLESVLEPVMLCGGEVLFREGEPGDSLYLIVNGRLRAHSSHSARRRAEFGTGDTTGESSVMARSPRSATVTAIRDSCLARLSGADFERICSRHGGAAIAFFTRKLVQVEREPVRPANPPPRTIALFASHRSVNLPAFAARLTACMGSGTRRVRLVTSESVNEALGGNASATIFGGARDASLVSWLNGKEHEYDCVLYQSDYETGPWAARCMRQADRVLMVADAKRTPRPGCFKAFAFAKGQPASLALLHPRGATPSGTSDWLNAHSFEQHFHLHEGDTEDFLRLSRWLSCRSLGLVLGGGFARGIAHLGVLRALGEVKVSIDALGGTSMGALIAAMHLCGHREDELFPVLREQGKSALRDFTFPMVSLLSGKKVREVVEPMVGDRLIEDLWLPAFFVATNLTRGRIEVLNRGPLLDAVLASSRVPGMFPPIVHGSDLLVDGGLVSNVPADVMRDFCPGPVIAVDVSPAVDFKAGTGVSSEASGWKLLRDRANPFGEVQEWPSVFSVLMRTMTFNSDASIERIRALADLYLAPPTGQFGFDDFDRGPEMANDAFQYARPEIVRWMKQRTRESSGAMPSA